MQHLDNFAPLNEDGSKKQGGAMDGGNLQYCLKETCELPNWAQAYRSAFA